MGREATSMDVKKKKRQRAGINPTISVCIMGSPIKNQNLILSISFSEI